MLSVAQLDNDQDWLECNSFIKKGGAGVRADQLQLNQMYSVEYTCRTVTYKILWLKQESDDQ